MSRAIHSVVKASQLPSGVLERSTLRGVFDVASCWAGVLLAALAVGLAPAWWSFAGAFLAVGLFQMRLINLGHHSFHQDLSPRRGVNDFLGRWLIVAPVMGTFSATRKNHLLHHKMLGDPNDPESEVYTLSKFGRTTKRGLLLWWAGKASGAQFLVLVKKYYLAPSRDGGGTRPAAAQKDRIQDLCAVVVSQTVLALAFYLITGLWWAYLALWILPGLTLTSLMLAMRAFSEHVSIDTPPNYLATFFCGFAERISLGSFNFHMHAEHHFFPSVPYYHLPKVRQKLLAEDAYKRTETRCLKSYLQPIRDTFSNAA